MSSFWNSKERGLDTEWLEEKPLIKTYCKRCREEGSLLAEIKSVGKNIHLDLLLQHENGTTHFLGKKALRSIKKAEHAETENQRDEQK